MAHRIALTVVATLAAAGIASASGVLAAVALRRIWTSPRHTPRA